MGAAPTAGERRRRDCVSRSGKRTERLHAQPILHSLQQPTQLHMVKHRYKRKGRKGGDQAVAQESAGQGKPCLSQRELETDNGWGQRGTGGLSEEPVVIEGAGAKPNIHRRWKQRENYFTTSDVPTGARMWVKDLCFPRSLPCTQI